MGIIDMDKLIQQSQDISVPLFHTVETNMKELSDRLNSIGDISMDGIEQIIVSSYRLFLDDSYLRNNVQRQATINVFSNKVFIKAMIDCIKKKSITLSNTQFICCNKLSWDAMFTDKIDNETKELLYQLSSSINLDIITPLSGYIDYDKACIIGLASRSSFDTTKCINRVNKILSKTKGIEIQTIVDIYSILYRNSLANLFISTMLDKSSISDDDRNEWYHIFYALLIILENIDPETISTVLIRYSQSYNLQGCPPVRFSLNNVSIVERFPRLHQVVHSLYIDNILVP